MVSIPKVLALYGLTVPVFFAIDMLWGAVLSGSVALASYAIGRKLGIL